MLQFIEHLVDIGIIVNKFSISTTNVLFSLSDFLKNLSASDSFDMAIRIYDCWKLQQIKKKNPEKLIQALNQISLKKYFSKIKQFNTNNKIQLSPFKSQRESHRILNNKSYQSPPQNELSKMGLNDTCERLYMESMIQKVKKEQLEQEKSKKDMQECTFKPEVHCQSINRNNTEVFERLYRTQLVGKHDYSEIKSKMEVSECTFTPLLNKHNSISNFQPTDQIFDRLYQESITRSNIKQSYTPLKELKELQSCTFKPQISRGQSRQLNQSESDIFNRLHNESADKQIVQAYQRIEKENKELQKCTFKPQINSHDSFQSCQQPAFERLYMVSSKQKKYSDESSRSYKTQSKGKEFIVNNESLYERMKSHVSKKKNNIDQIRKEVDKELTFKPNLHRKLSNDRELLKNQSMSSIKSEQKNKSTKSTNNSLSTYVYNIRKTMQDKENSNLSIYCETACFEGDLRQFQTQRKQN